jgi:hypothetical protein
MHNPSKILKHYALRANPFQVRATGPRKWCNETSATWAEHPDKR